MHDDIYDIRIHIPVWNNHLGTIQCDAIPISFIASIQAWTPVYPGCAAVHAEHDDARHDVNLAFTIQSNKAECNPQSASMTVALRQGTW